MFDAKQNPKKSAIEFISRVKLQVEQLWMKTPQKIKLPQKSLIQAQIVKGINKKIKRFVLSRNPTTLDETIKCVITEEENQKLLAEKENQKLLAEKMGLAVLENDIEAEVKIKMDTKGLDEQTTNLEKSK